MRKKRHNYTPEEKVFILKRHLAEHVPVSDLCDEYQLQPKIFYRWHKQFFENGAKAFVRGGDNDKRAEAQKIKQLEQEFKSKKRSYCERLACFAV